MRVIVTRPREQAGPLVARLEALGHEVVECPLIEIERTSDEPIDAAGYDWLVVTSPNGADEIARRGRNLPKVAAVGPGTAERLREHGLEPAFVPRVSSQDGLLAEFPRPAGRVLFAAAENSRRGPIDELGADFVPLYATRLLAPEPPDGRRRRARLRLGRARVRRRSAARARGRRSGPQTTRVAESVGLTRRRRGGDARPRRARRGRRRGSVAAREASLHHLPHRLRAHGRLRRHVPRRDQADRARRRDHRRHARHRAAGRAPGRARAAQHAAVHAGRRAPRGRRSRASAARAGRSSSATRTAAVRRPRQRPARARRRARRDRRARTSSPTRATRSSRCRAPSTGATSSRRPPRTSRSASSPSELGPPLAPDALVRLDLPEPEIGATRVVDATRALRRPLRERAAQPDARATSTSVGIVPGTRFELELAGERYYAIAARTFADARPGRARPLRGLVPATSRSRSTAATRPRCSPRSRASTICLHLEQP